MAEIRAGLTTEMKYAVVSSQRDFGPVARQHGDDREFWGMRKPPFEAYKMVEVLRAWGATVYPVGDVETVAGIRAFPALRDLPDAVDCAVISLPADQTLALMDDVIAARVPVVWLQYGAGNELVRQACESRGVRVVSGCVLLHWEVDHVSGIAKGRHICHMHGNLVRAARIHLDENGVAQRVAPAVPQAMPFNRETFGTKLLLPIWPKNSRGSGWDR